MNDLEQNGPSVAKLGPLGRRAVSITKDSLVKTAPLRPGQRTPLVIQPAIDGVNLIAWAETSREFIETQLLHHGGIIFRDFNLKGVTQFEQFIKTVAGELLHYNYQSTPRSPVSGQIYTSTEYPAHQSIPLHNEMAYAHDWPMKICFYCVLSATNGGETPIADSRQVYARIDPEVRKRLAQKKIMYVRNYGAGVDLPWATVFQTQNQFEVEDYCRRAGIEFEWREGNRLRTRQICQAVAAHPRTGEMVWFNQAHLFHVSNLEPELRESLFSAFEEDDLPRNAFYGDGTRLETEVLDHIRDAYRQEAIVFPWQEGDVLMLDNMLVAHGRTPFSGPRQIVVGMAQPSSSAAL